ncbi:hypothetical protein OESDEN_11490 [Oesophagostomum dentatum]|uniref:Uncharacterized protein n=1 Tax=Oesophagostomum dentatum TaxID=61180 RepID=A0A0B1SUU6_OESDE|nr:hypothetical protein OESDEN_11490 [Oesophagostomum dentatum]
MNASAYENDRASVCRKDFAPVSNVASSKEVKSADSILRKQQFLKMLDWLAICPTAGKTSVLMTLGVNFCFHTLA